MEYGYVEINSESGPFDSSGVHTAWREHRAALVDLGDKEWRAVEHAVMAIVYPECELPRHPDSHNATLELALALLEPHTALPRGLRGFT
jgi:hypothetical protein